MSMYVWHCVFGTCVKIVSEARGGPLIPQSWRYSKFWATGHDYWALTELGFSRRTESIWAIFPAATHQCFSNGKFTEQVYSTVVESFPDHLAHPWLCVQCPASPAQQNSNISLYAQRFPSAYCRFFLTLTIYCSVQYQDSASIQLLWFW